MGHGSKRRHKIEPYNINEILESPSLKGLVSFLNIPPTDAAANEPQAIEKTEPSTVDALESSTIDDSETSTVVFSKTSTVDGRRTRTVDVSEKTTVDSSNASTVDVSEGIGAAGQLASIWIASNGEVFASSRVHRIKRAQDALTHEEEAVYDFLWGTKNTSKEDRIVEAGYSLIAEHARVSKRAVSRIVERLIAKGFIAIQREADINRRLSTQYRVFGYKAALESMHRCGHLWVVRAGRGVLFVRQLKQSSTVAFSKSSTVDVSEQPTVDVSKRSTVGAGQSSTVGARQSSTVDSGSPPPIGILFLDNKGQSSSRLLIERCSKNGIPLDDAAARTIVQTCRSLDQSATEDEIVHFTDEKIAQLRHSRNVGNFVGLLIKAVPEYFAPPATELQRYRAGKAEERAKSRDLAQKTLDDPASTPQDREWANEVLRDQT